MAKVARVGDSISHGGSIIEGSGSLSNEGKPVARVGDAVSCVIHGIQHITSGSSKLFNEGKAVARVGDSISCGAVISSGSNTWDDGG